MNKFYFVFAFCVWGLISCGGSSEKSTTETVAEAKPTQEEAKEEKPQVHPGMGIYKTYCQVCHQANGEGVPGMNPPLTQTEYVLGEKERIIGIVLNGLTGEIEIKGETYNNVMASHSFLTDQQIANVLSFVRSSFGNDADAVTPEEVAAVRASSGN
ncbi:c-type cytochrome [Chondrinema litorale]|uniref:c-type cytochrome n=1 Tax=Chondrinema litorale TaxID=2994555 RepID=UPI0025437CE4|nr:cytochrome c [Chondrinema litorale]UZR93329.1 cytochrome c [Chondrinema litorale]